MSNGFHHYFRFIERLNKVIEYVLVVFLAIMVVSISIQVFGRYIIGFSTSWSEELARVLMIFIVVLGSAIALRRGQMLSVDILIEFAGQKGIKTINIIINLISIIFYYVILVYGLKLAVNVSGQQLPGLGISVFWMYIALPISGFLLIINAITNILDNIMVVRDR